MYIQIDLRTVPAVTTLKEADDFTAFKVTIRRADHTFVSPAALTNLAGEVGLTSEWQSNLTNMIEFAASRGWTNEAGDIQAHIELAE